MSILKDVFFKSLKEANDYAERLNIEESRNETNKAGDCSK